MTEAPAGSGFFTALAVGSFSTTSDRDYWRFDAEAGDHITARLEADQTSVFPQLYLQNAAGSNLVTAGGDFSGVVQIQNYTVTAPGTYYLLVFSNNNPARYQMRVDQARVPTLETEGNDSQGAANSLSFTGTGGVLQAGVAGALTAGDGGDYFGLSTLNAGNAISLSVALPSFGTLSAANVQLSVEKA